jgi:hypothetical protein
MSNPAASMSLNSFYVVLKNFTVLSLPGFSTRFTTSMSATVQPPGRLADRIERALCRNGARGPRLASLFDRNLLAVERLTRSVASRGSGPETGHSI